MSLYAEFSMTYFLSNNTWKIHATAKNANVAVSLLRLSSLFSGVTALESLPHGAQFGEAKRQCVPRVKRHCNSFF